VYAHHYHATTRAPLKGPAPVDPATPPNTKIASLLAKPVSCDGVVPTRSQTLDGRPLGVILGDHLDVTGSFPRGRGADVMRSNAHFREPEFDKLWRDVAGDIREADGLPRAEPTATATPIKTVPRPSVSA
jgi:hypothetical protein